MISIVICAYSLNRLNQTLECIDSIFDNDYKDYEIILVVDGNRELKERIEKSIKRDIIILENIKNEGPSYSRNKGAKNAKGDIIAFIDDDAFAMSDWLKKIANNFNDPQISVIGGKILPYYENGSSKLPEEILWIVGGTYKGHPQNKQIVRNIFSGNMAVRKYIFNKVNFELMFNKKNNLSHQLEDTLFCIRTNNYKNNTVMYDPEMIVYHHVPKDRLKTKYLLKRAFSEGRLKAKLQNLIKSKDTLSSEHNYLNLLIKSILKNLITLKIRDFALLSLITFTVSIGYMREKYAE